jgi:hypothetical protein
MISKNIQTTAPETTCNLLKQYHVNEEILEISVMKFVGHGGRKIVIIKDSKTL